MPCKTATLYNFPRTGNKEEGKTKRGREVMKRGQKVMGGEAQRQGGEKRRQMEINGPYKSNSVNSPEWKETEEEEE